MGLQFAVGREPLAVHRGGRVDRYLHVRIPDVGALSLDEREELAAWLAASDVDIAECVGGLVVATDPDGACVVRVGAIERAAHLATAPAWIRAPQPVESADGPLGRPPVKRASTRDNG